jgi:hypothetical protein
VRPHGKTKLGFFPLPTAEAARLGNCLTFDREFSAVDPSVGDGVAFTSLSTGVEAHRYGVEIDANRAEQARVLGIETLQANTMDVRCPAESISLLGVQVVISHPKLVETGLDLLDFRTIIFYESGYSLNTLRQARRRSWRIGQRRPVRVKFLCYEGTMQTACLRLMGKKLLVALTMEGKFAGEGLQNIDEDDDMLSAMARELVETNGIGETADAVWKALNAEHQKLFPTMSGSSGDAALIDTPATSAWAQANPADLVEEAIAGGSVLIFGQRPGSLGHKKSRSRSVPEQSSLFNFG